jgi:hypothetical protein
MDLPLAFDSGPISLVCGKGYFFEIVDDKETSIPEPASAGLLGLAGIMALVRSRARRVIP